MRRCFGCFKQIDENAVTCPYCSYSNSLSPKNDQYLAPGSILSNRYTIGKILSTDSESITYVAWDSLSDLVVKIQELFPVECVFREPGSTNVTPKSAEAADKYNNYYSVFVEKAKLLYSGGGNEKLYDCIPDNGTAYMILEYKPSFKTTPATNQKANSTSSVSSNVIRATETKKHTPAQKKEPVKNSVGQKAETSRSNITVLTSAKKENRLYEFTRKISLIPLWVKVLVPSIILVSVVLIVLFSNGIIKLGKKTTESSVPVTIPTESSEITATTKGTTETEPVVLVLKGPVMVFKGHSYTIFSDSDSWDKAKSHCESLGGHLAVITSKEENDAIWAFVNKNGCKSAFFGLSDSPVEGQWKWVTGEPISYSNWNNNEPNESSAANDYAEFSFYADGGVWSASAFETHFEDAVLSYVCEWETDVTGSSQRSLNSEQATLAFQYHITKIIGTNKIKNDTEESWGLVKEVDNICTFHYIAGNKECTVFYMDMKTGKTTSLTYTDSGCRNIITMGDYDFNAWDYLDVAKNTNTDSSAVQLQKYLGANIVNAAKEIGDLGDMKQKNGSYYENKYLRLATNDTPGSLDIATITLSGDSKQYSIYNVMPGLSWNDAITNLMLSGSTSIYRKDKKTITVKLNNGNALKIDFSDKEQVTKITLWRENT